MIKVIALDDHPFVLEGYQAVLDQDTHIRFVRGFANGIEAEKYLDTEKCDVLMLDIHLSEEKDGIHWCKIFKKKYVDLKILGISTFDEFGIIKSFLNAGGNGFILKTARQEILREAIIAVSEGNEYLQSQLKEALLAQSLKNKSPNDYLPRLSRREKEILKLIVEEMTTHEIAQELNLSIHTVESHRSNLIAKLQVKNVAGLVREALLKNLF